MDHPNIDLVRNLYGAFMASDAERLRAAFDPDVRLDVSGFDPNAGAYEGVDAVLGYFFAAASPPIPASRTRRLLMTATVRADG